MSPLIRPHVANGPYGDLMLPEQLQAQHCEESGDGCKCQD